MCPFLKRELCSQCLWIGPGAEKCFHRLTPAWHHLLFKTLLEAANENVQLGRRWRAPFTTPLLPVCTISPERDPSAFLIFFIYTEWQTLSLTLSPTLSQEVSSEWHMRAMQLVASRKHKLRVACVTSVGQGLDLQRDVRRWPCVWL